MRRRRGWIALAALGLLGGCAHPAQQEADAAQVPGRAVAARTPAVSCATKDVLIATVSKCGDGGLRFGVAAE